MDFRLGNANGDEWDFSNDNSRSRAWRMVMEENPDLVIGGPLPQDKKIDQGRIGDARKHLEFMCKLYKVQHYEDQFYLHDHLVTSWVPKEEYIWRMREILGSDMLRVNEGGRRSSKGVLLTNCLR